MVQPPIGTPRDTLKAKIMKPPSFSSIMRGRLPRGLGGGKSGTSVFPYTEDLDLNVRKALKELRQDLIAPSEQCPFRMSEESTICANIEPAEGLSRASAPDTTSNQYVVDCVDGKIRVTAIPLCHAKARGVSTALLQDEPISRMDTSAKTPMVNPSDGNTTFARSSSSVLDSSYASCSSTTDGESGILNLSGIDMSSVATWAQQSPRNTCAPHPRFYFTDGTLELQVEDSLYKIHRHFFEHYSTFFVAVFTTLRSDSIQTSSVTDPIIQLRNPIHLPDMTTIEFDRLLSIIYPEYIFLQMLLRRILIISSSFAICDITSMEDWISVLNLSCKLEFASIRDLAIHNIAPSASIMDKAILGKRYAVKSWIMDAYTEFCTRERPLSIEEGRRLGIDLVIKINELRHELFYDSVKLSRKPGLEIRVDPLGTTDLGEVTSVPRAEFEELPERVVQHFKLHTLDDGTPGDEGIYFKTVLDANQ